MLDEIRLKFKNNTKYITYQISNELQLTIVDENTENTGLYLNIKVFAFISNGISLFWVDQTKVWNKINFKSL